MENTKTKKMMVTHISSFGITLVDSDGNHYASLSNKFGLVVGKTIEVEYKETVIGVENGITYQHIDIVNCIMPSTYYFTYKEV